MATPQVFVSHSHADNEYCRTFVAALRQALDDDDADAVWYDEHNLGWGELWQEIDRQLLQRQHFIAILSPNAVTSKWVNREIHAAMSLLDQKRILTIQFVTATPCDIPPLLAPYKRIERAGGVPLPPQDAARKAYAVITGRQIDAHPPLSPLPDKSRDALPPLGPAPVPANSVPAHHLTPMPLYNLGFRGYSVAGVECILPPLCPVPAGVFTMGSDKISDLLAHDSEMLQYPVEVGGFAIGQHPVTVAEYACAVRVKAVREPPKKLALAWLKQLERPDHPVVSVSWLDAVAYADWLAETTGQSWRLPTESEWEKAARGIDGRIYPWGNTFDKAYCNTAESRIGTTTPVGRYVSGESPYHAQDMAGNVWELTSSLFMPYPYQQSDGREYQNSAERRVKRGGAWYDYHQSVRVANRLQILPDYVSHVTGFRLGVGAD